MEAFIKIEFSNRLSSVIHDCTNRTRKVAQRLPIPGSRRCQRACSESFPLKLKLYLSAASAVAVYIGLWVPGEMPAYRAGRHSVTRLQFRWSRRRWLAAG